MTARIISGKAVARTVREEAAERVRQIRGPLGRAPGLTVVLVGEDPASMVYVGRKEKASAAVGVRSETLRLPADTDQATLLETVRRLNADEAVDGVLVQLPLPGQIDEQTVIEAIDPAKDVDGFHPLNQGRMLAGLPGLRPCTPAGIVELLQRGGVPLAGARAVVVGRSNIVGKPVAAMLMRKGVDATVTVCHSRTRELAVHTRTADVLVAALGRPQAITAEMVRDGAVVIDVGIHRIDDGEGGTRLVGDVDFDGVSRLASAITPVPGGVGPMTVAMLMRNTVEAAAARL
jgi:methylenetetrahydrofolate dehydrogenase (NADP+) / methenyltetrahydrofolate cyclohydrolase